jgi:hypothetical protein
MGVQPLAPIADGTLATLFQPDGPAAPSYLLTGNYKVILQYNCSNYYALSVGLLADEIARYYASLAALVLLPVVRGQAAPRTRRRPPGPRRRPSGGAGRLRHRRRDYAPKTGAYDAEARRDRREGGGCGRAQNAAPAKLCGSHPLDSG